MKALLLGIAALAAVGGGVYGVQRLSEAGAAPRKFELVVTADDRSVYAQSWDGMEGGLGVPGFLGGMSLPGFAMFSTVSPPDLAVCTVDLDGADCQFRDTEGGKPESYYHDRFEAKFPVEISPRKPFGIIVYDIDGTLPYGLDPDDLLDAVILAPAGADTAEIEQAVRDMIEQISPTERVWQAGKPDEKRFTLSPGERKRREGPIPVLTLNECRKEACRLQQSQIVFE